VAPFSSRGPVSPFYLKPEIVAPGAYINTTKNDMAYNIASGTSYAAPHISGAAALLLQKNPELHHHEIKSLLLTTTEPVSDAYGKEFLISDTGSGRLDIENAFKASLIITPPNFVVNVSGNESKFSKQFELKLINGTLEELDIKFEGPEFIDFSYFLEGDDLQIKMNVNGKDFGEYEGKLIINHAESRYTIPFLLHYTSGSVFVNQQDQKLFFEVKHPEKWSFAKISITNNKNLKTDTTTITPEKKSSIKIYENGEYWIDAKIRVNGTTSNAYNTIKVTTLSNNIENIQFNIPEKQIGLIIVIVTIVGVIGLLKKK